MKKEPTQENNALEIKLSDNTRDILGQVIEFLQLFLPATLAKRLVAILLLAIGIPVKNAVELTGLCEKSMWTLKKRIREASVRELMAIKSGSGRKAKSDGLGEQILSELESGNYHTRQQIADMIEEKYNVRMSRSSVGRFLKKTASNG